MENILIVSLVIIALVAGLILYFVAYIRKTEAGVYRRVLISNLGKRFPDYYDEFTDKLAKQMLEARAKFSAAWEDKHVKGNKAEGEDKLLVDFLKPHVSKDFHDHITVDPHRDEILRTAIFDAILISGNAKLRTWVDLEGKVQTNMDGTKPPSWW